MTSARMASARLAGRHGAVVHRIAAREGQDVPWTRNCRVAGWFAVIVIGLCAMAPGGFATDSPGAILERQIGVGYPTAVAFSPDGSLCLSTNLDGTLRLWDVATGRGLRRIMLEGHRASAIAFTLDGSHIHCIEGGLNIFLTTLETATGRVVERVGVGMSDLSALALSPCGRYAVLGLAGEISAVWDFAAKSPLFGIGHDAGDPGYGVRFSRDGRFVAVNTERTGLRVWDVAAGTPILQLLEPGAYLPLQFDCSPDGSKVAHVIRLNQAASSGQNTEIRVWDLASGAEPTVHRYRLRDSPRALRYLPDGQSLLVMHGTIGGSVVGLESNQVLGTFSGFKASDDHLEVSPQGIVPLYSGVNELHLYRVLERETAQLLPGHLSFVNSFAVARDGSKIAVASPLWYFPHILSAHGDRSAIVVGDIANSAARQVSLSSDGAFALLMGWFSTLYNTTTGGWIQGYGDFTTPAATAIALASDASFAVISLDDGRVYVWPTGADQPSRVLRDYGRRKRKISLSADDRYLATGAEDGAVSVWDLHTGRHVQQFRDLTAGVISVALSPDASRLVAGDSSMRLLMWDVDTGAVLAWHRKLATAAAFDVAGDRVAVANYRTINILDGRNGAPMYNIGEDSGVNRAHTGQVELLQFSLDDTRLFSASPRDGVKQWLLDATAPRPGHGTCHSADADCDGRIVLGELMRIIQFYTSGGYHCADPVWGAEDAYHAGPGSRSDCAPHDGDYNPPDWRFTLQEVLRAVQLYRIGGYAACGGGEDGFCPADS